MKKPALADEICYKLKQSLIVAPLKGKTSFKCKNWISHCTGTGSGAGTGTCTSTGTTTMYVRRCMKINDNQNGGGVLFAHDYIAIKNTCNALDLELTNHLKVKHFICSSSWFSFLSTTIFHCFMLYFLLFLGFCCNFKGNFILPFQLGFHYLKAQCWAIYCAWRSCCACSVCISFQNDFSAHLPLPTRRKNHNELQTK